MLTQIIIFIIFSVFFVIFSWRSLKNPQCHGFYRFFAFEGILILLLINYPYWTKQLERPQQWLSWCLLTTSIFFVIQGFYLLKRKGGKRLKKIKTENLDFENTQNLITEGIYHYIRHPMYGSLILLTWGAVLKNMTFLTIGLSLIITFFMLITAIIEEQENKQFFGDSYNFYCQKSKRFIPFIF